MTKPTYSHSDNIPQIGDRVVSVHSMSLFGSGGEVMVTGVRADGRGFYLSYTQFCENPNHYRLVSRPDVSLPEPVGTLDFRVSADLTGAHGAAIEVLLGGPTGLGLVLADAIQARDALNRLIPKLQALNSLLGVE